eukprot:3988468-Alexandrium_andersonii.AAC.1
MGSPRAGVGSSGRAAILSAANVRALRKVWRKSWRPPALLVPALAPPFPPRWRARRARACAVEEPGAGRAA